MGLKLVGEVSLDGSGFEAGLNKLEHAAGHFGETLKGVALEAFGIYTIEQAFAKTLETAKELVLESQRLGIGVEGLQVLRQAAKDSSVEMSSLAKAFEKIDIAREKALGHSVDGQKLKARFAQLGISEADLKHKTAADLFTGKMHDKASGMNPETLGPILRDILGKGFGELIPLLKTDFDELSKKLHKMGAIMSGETALKLKRLGDEFDLIGTILVSAVAPALVAFAEWLMKLASSKAMEGLIFMINRFTGQNKLPDFVGSDGTHYTAADRANKAANSLEPLRVMMGKGKSFDEIKAALHLGEKGHGAEDFTGKTTTDINKYLNSLIQPIADVDNASATAAETAMAGIKKTIEEFKKPPKPIIEPNFGANPDEMGRKRPHMTEDAMIRVGNFLGSSASPLEGIATQQLDVLRLIERNTRDWGAVGYSPTEMVGVPP
jgi:hypothetical protein